MIFAFNSGQGYKLGRIDHKFEIQIDPELECDSPTN